MAFHVFSTVLIIACPCAVALSMPFAFGNLSRLFSRENIYLKNIHVIENCSNINCLVFDKTGTITESSDKSLSFYGKSLTSFEKNLVASLANNSIHVLSKMIYKYFTNGKTFKTINFKEKKGFGITGTIEKTLIKIGSKKFITQGQISKYAEVHSFPKDANIYVEINNEVVGSIIIKTKFRNGLASVLNKLHSNFFIHLISGDNDSDKQHLNKLFSKWKSLLFLKSPFEKLSFIKNLQKQEFKTAMIGDGLNDAGALSQSNVGISISKDTSNFTPSCDIILGADNFEKLPVIFSICKNAVRLIYASYFIAVAYNIIGLYYAVQGLLSPVIAAILMPLSSISIVLFGFISSSILFKLKFK